MSRWEELLSPSRPAAATPRAAACAGKSVLVTGGGGFIGAALAKSILRANSRQVLLLEHSEENLYRINLELEEQFPRRAYRTILGDISDPNLVHEILGKWKLDVIFHAAAFKHVPLMEENPFAVIRNNALGTRVLAEAAAEHGVPRLVLISTDKAVNPRSIMGASKRIAELTLERLQSSKTQMSSVRFGNVFGSNGSVVPRFREQIAAGGPVCLTHADARRYFLTPAEAIELILSVAALADGNGVFLPELGEPLGIVDLAKRLIALEARDTAGAIEIRITGLRPGEKLTEELIADRESPEATAEPGLLRVRGEALNRVSFDASFEQLRKTAVERNLAALLDAVCELVPGYCPSTTLLGLLSPQEVREKL
ncbi:MAG TPA: polysaccharide biosynthesis protein [Candidatus Saccharimonadales bacterium]|nr:polysaccharide biosynthesis protein [Candidatus Saccharimonadales bacterium]